MNLVERFFSALTTKQLPRGVHRSVKDLKAAIYVYLAERYTHPTPVGWTKTADEILDNIKRFCQRTSASGH